MGSGLVLIGLVALQRLWELRLARRNTRRLLARGGVEQGAGHYPLFILLHGSWLIANAVWILMYAPSVNWFLICVFVLLQLGRLWVIRSLGPFWTTRVITLADAPLIRKGPYRWFRHPNYLIVALEIAVLPIAFGAWWIAVVFSGLNAALLAHRLRVEKMALIGRDRAEGAGPSLL